MLDLPCITDFGGSTFGLGLIGARAGRQWVEFLPEWGEELRAGQLDAVAFVVDEDMFDAFRELVLHAAIAALDPDGARQFHWCVRHLPPFNGREVPVLAVVATCEAPPPAA